MALIGLVPVVAACFRVARVESPAAADRADPVRPALAGPSYAFINGRWFTGAGFVHKTFYAINGVFTDRAPARVDSTLDLHDRYAIPPFGDPHTHNLDGSFNLDTVRAAYLREGTFYVQVLTNSRSGATRVRERFSRPCDLDVAYANGGLTSTLSHPFLAYEPRAMGLYDGRQWAAHAAEIRKSRLREGDAYWFLDSLADIDAKWPRILEAHPDLLKIFLLDATEAPPVRADTGLPGGTGLRPSLVPEIVRRAHAAGLRVAAHIETANDFRIALLAGVDLFAHLPGYEMAAGENPGRFEIDDATARLAAQRGVAVTPTLSLAAVVERAADSATLVRMRLRVQERNLRLLRRAGVTIAVGSDWYGRTASREFNALAATGIWSKLELLRLWGEETARAIFPTRRIGRLENGFEASFLLLAEDPLRSLDALGQIRLRVKQGCLIH